MFNPESLSDPYVTRSEPAYKRTQQEGLHAKTLILKREGGCDYNRGEKEPWNYRWPAITRALAKGGDKHGDNWAEVRVIGRMGGWHDYRRMMIQSWWAVMDSEAEGLKRQRLKQQKTGGRYWLPAQTGVVSAKIDWWLCSDFEAPSMKAIKRAHEGERERESC